MICHIILHRNITGRSISESMNNEVAQKLPMWFTEFPNRTFEPFGGQDVKKRERPFWTMYKHFVI